MQFSMQYDLLIDLLQQRKSSPSLEQIFHLFHNECDAWNTTGVGITGNALLD